MEENKSDDADIVEMAGETVAADTGATEVGAASGGKSDAESNNERPVGADTKVKVEGEEE
jgi:hypothetical protein